MNNICKVCGNPSDCWGFYKGEKVCWDCCKRLEKEDIVNEAVKSDCAKYFKDWSSQDRTTAFFECFGRYIKQPNKRDILTIYHIWLWACHADHGLTKSIDYTFKWAKKDLYTEYDKWKEVEDSEENKNIQR